jgi:hypothetical protein
LSLDWLTTYRPKFQRHLWSLAVNGFYARDLDADDFALLEQIRECGNVACGSLGDLDVTPALYNFENRPRSGRVLDEELSFWNAPWAVELGVPRRVGTGRIAPQLDPVLQAKWAARAAKRKADRDAAKMQREQMHVEAMTAWKAKRRAMEYERQQRMLQTMLSDIEWEQAAPSNKTMLKKSDRHYGPEWKLRQIERQTSKHTRAQINQAMEAEAVKTMEATARLKRQITDKMKKKIMGHIRMATTPGTFLQVEELARAVGASPAVVWAACSELAGSGFVRTR